MIDDLFKQLEDTGVLSSVPVEVVEKTKKAVRKADKATRKAKEAVSEIKEILVTQGVTASNEVVEIPSKETLVAADLKQVYKTYEDFDYESLLTYAGLDCIVTSEVLAAVFPIIVEEPKFYLPIDSGIKKEIKAPAIIKSVQEIEMVAHEFILDLEINGLKYDVAKNREFSARMVGEISELEDRIFSKLGRRVNLDSGVEVSRLLYGEMNLVAPFTTKSGEPSTDGEALLTLAGLDPMGGKYVAPDPELQFLADMAKRKDINSVHNTFIRTYVEDFVKRDGRIHPSYNLHGTSSFRITGDNPNLTQLPRPKHGYNVRECYVVEPGNVFIAADWSSAEVKILGALSKDPVLLKAIADGLDFHSFSASQMLGVPYEEFIAILADKSTPLSKQYKLARQNAKALTFGIDIGTIL